MRARIRDVTKVVQIDGDFPDDRVITLEGLLGLGHEYLVGQPRALSQRLYAVRRQGLAALPYARDQRGNLRGVRLSHAALTYQAAAVAALGELAGDDLLYVALPLSTAYARRFLGIQLACGFPVALEGRADQRRRLARHGASDMSGRRRRCSAGCVSRDRGQNRIPALPSAAGSRDGARRRRQDVRRAAPVRGAAGSGIDADLMEFFDLAGVAVLEAYGRPETGGAVCVALPDDRGSRYGGPAAARDRGPDRGRRGDPGRRGRA